MTPTRLPGPTRSFRQQILERSVLSDLKYAKRVGGTAQVGGRRADAAALSGPPTRLYSPDRSRKVTTWLICKLLESCSAHGQQTTIRSNISDFFTRAPVLGHVLRRWVVSIQGCGLGRVASIGQRTGGPPRPLSSLRKAIGRSGARRHLRRPHHRPAHLGRRRSRRRHPNGLPGSNKPPLYLRNERQSPSSMDGNAARTGPHEAIVPVR